MIYAMDLKNLLFSAHIFEVGENNDIGMLGAKILVILVLQWPFHCCRSRFFIEYFGCTMRDVAPGRLCGIVPQ